MARAASLITRACIDVRWHLSKKYVFSAYKSYETPLMLSESLNPDFLVLPTELKDIGNYVAALTGVGFAVSTLREPIPVVDDERVIIAHIQR
jgi:hypothetical protein